MGKSMHSQLAFRWGFHYVLKRCSSHGYSCHLFAMAAVLAKISCKLLAQVEVESACNICPAKQSLLNWYGCGVLVFCDVNAASWMMDQKKKTKEEILACLYLRIKDSWLPKRHWGAALKLFSAKEGPSDTLCICFLLQPWARWWWTLGFLFFMFFKSWFGLQIRWASEHKEQVAPGVGAGMKQEEMRGLRYKERIKQ